jgi:two-component system response regulator HydG
MKIESGPISRPVRSLRSLPRVLVVEDLAAVARIVKREGLKHEVASTIEEAEELIQRAELRDLGRFGRMIGASGPMQATYDVLGRVGATEAPVLLTGETGTGKELAARTLHDLSKRRDKPFLAINCGAVSPNMIESEVFGHERGSFTGAAQRHSGFFERTAGGTLFLDEITEMTSELQVKLLRVLESGTLVRVGGERETPVNVRVIAATNLPPEQAVAERKLRRDLFYRLAVVHIRMPPLRARGDDIRAIAEHFLAACNEESGTSKRFTEEAVAALRTHSWPGNVRELKNVVQGAFIMADEQIGPEGLPFNGYGHDAPAAHGVDLGRPDPAVSPGGDGGDEPRELRIRIGTSASQAERLLILATLSACGGRRSETARVLSMSSKTLYNRLRAYEGLHALHIATATTNGLHEAKVTGEMKMAIPNLHLAAGDRGRQP